MITLGYDLSATWNPQSQRLDLRAVDEAALRYDCFLGDVEFVVDGADFSARWGWVPVFDFALSLRTIAGALVTRDHERFEFTESDATIEFSRRDEAVHLEASYSPETAELRHVELCLEAERFLGRVIEGLGRSWPDLRKNVFVEALSRELAVSG